MENPDFMTLSDRPNKSPEDRAKPTPWGLLATLGFSGLTILANGVLGIVVATGFAAITHIPELEKDPTRLLFDGNLVTASILVSSPFIFALTLYFVNLRRGPALKDYLGLHEVDGKQILLWLFVLLLFAGASNLIAVLLKRPAVDPFMSSVYATATFKPLLWIALVVAAPVSEEVFFRGFLLYGILNTRLGPIGAVFLSALIWAPLHFQYDLYGITTVLTLGVVFGYARLRTNSVYIPIAMHALMNVIAAMEVMLHITFTAPGS